ncbi:arsenical pump-driving ATPase, partial [Klebsiella pneumoniae]
EVVKNQHASRIALVPVMAAEPTGIEKLRELAV